MENTQITHQILILSRSSLIHFACIGVAPPRLFTPQAKGIKNIHASLWSCPSKSGWMVDRYFFQKASQGNLCIYIKLTLVSKELKTVFQYMDQKPRYLIKSIYSGSMLFYQIRSCPSCLQKLNSISTDTQCLPNLILFQIIPMLRKHKMNLILMPCDDAD